MGNKYTQKNIYRCIGRWREIEKRKKIDKFYRGYK